MSEYRPNEWIPVVGVKTMGDKALQETQNRLHALGVTTSIKRDRKSRQIVLWRRGGWPIGPHA